MQLEAQLDILEREGLLRSNGESERSYIFKHVLTQETAYAALLLQDRRRLHRHVAEICEELFANELGDYYALLAFHYTAAGERAQAVSYWYRYGEQALQISAFPEAQRAFESALGLLPQEPTGERARIFLQLGELHSRHADYELARTNFQNALVVAVSAGDPKSAARALTGIARLESHRGGHAEAHRLGIEALRWANDSGDPEAIARAHRQLGIAENYDGNNELAQEHLNAALEIFQTLGQKEGISSCLNSLGIVARDEHELERARSYFEQALALSQELQDRYGVGVRLVNLGVVAEQSREYETATRYQIAALAIAEEIGDREGSALIHLNLGSLALERGERARAMQEYRYALSEAIALGTRGLALYVIAAIAKLELALGREKSAAEMLGLAFYHPSSTADIKADFNSVRTELELKLPQAELDEALARGKALDLQETARAILA